MGRGDKSPKMRRRTGRAAHKKREQKVKAAQCAMKDDKKTRGQDRRVTRTTVLGPGQQAPTKKRRPHRWECPRCHTFNLETDEKCRWGLCKETAPWT